MFSVAVDLIIGAGDRVNKRLVLLCGFFLFQQLLFLSGGSALQ